MNQDNAQQIITQLASISLIDYERVREAQAKNLGIRVTALDCLVKEQRNCHNKNETSTALLFPDSELWPTEVNGGDLLARLSALIQKHVILESYEANAIALWVVFTHCIDAASTAPILNICSPEKRCGKSTLITLLESLVYRPLLASNISSAAVFRTIEAYKPTLLLDEVDTFISDEKSELRGIINSGHTRFNAFVIRTVGEDHTPQRFTTWCAKCLAGIGNLPDTIKDRSIIITLKRKLIEVKVDKIRHANKSEIFDLQRQCTRFAKDNISDLALSRPLVPEELNDRAADSWEILFAIADVAGKDWPHLARKSAIRISGSEESISTSVELLQDIRNIFETKNINRLSSTDLINHLCEDEESPWATYNHGKPISARQLARRLKEFKISSKSIRLPNDTTPKGFHRSSFEDAFKRYLPSESATPQQSNYDADCEVVTQTPQNKMLRNKDTFQALPDKTCGGVADKSGKKRDGITPCTRCNYMPPFCSCVADPDLNREISED